MEQTIERLQAENAELRKQAADALGYKTALDNQVEANCELRTIAKKIREALEAAATSLGYWAQGAVNNGASVVTGTALRRAADCASAALAEIAIPDPTDEAVLAERDARVRAPLEARIAELERDIQILEANCVEVFLHVTEGRIGKINTEASVVIDVCDNLVDKLVRGAVVAAKREILEEMKRWALGRVLRDKDPDSPVENERVQFIEWADAKISALMQPEETEGSFQDGI